MALTPEIQQTLDQLNAQYKNAGDGPVTWGFDEGRGAYYHVSPGGRQAGQRIYENTTMPGSTTGSTQPSGGGLVHGGAQWDQSSGTWKTPLDWGKVLSWGVGAGLGAGAASAAGLFGGGAGAASSGGAFSAATGGAPATIGAAAIPTGVASGAGAGMGLSDLFLKYGLPAIGNLVGLGVQSNAQNNATKAQMDYYNRALDAAKEEQQYQRGVAEDEKNYQRGRYADFAKAYAPYQAAAANALGATNQALATGWSPYARMAGAAEPTVMLKSPTGQMKAVPQSQADHFLSRGAVRV